MSDKEIGIVQPHMEVHNHPSQISLDHYAGCVPPSCCYLHLRLVHSDSPMTILAGRIRDIRVPGAHVRYVGGFEPSGPCEWEPPLEEV